MEFVAEAGLQRSRNAGSAEQQRIQHIVRAALARQHQVLVERCLQSPRIGDAQHCVRLLDVVGDAHARLGLTGHREAVIQIPAHAQIEEPVPGLDLVLNVQRQFLHVGMAEVVVRVRRRG